MSQHIESLQVGDAIMCEGPIGKLKYFGWGNFENMRKKLPVKTHVALLCAGSGLTPHLQLAQASLLAGDGVMWTMLYFNKTKKDIMCEDTLQQFKDQNPITFNLHHCLTRHSAKDGEWNSQLGRPSAEMFKRCGFPEPGEQTLVCICGPQGFKVSCQKILSELGFQED